MPRTVCARVSSSDRRGRSQLTAALSRYARAQRFRHPTPSDLWSAFDASLGPGWGSRVLRRALECEAPSALQVQGERPVFKVGDLSVDLVRRIVKVKDAEVKLSPKEYDLLRVLVQHAGKVLTHRFLLGELWDTLTDAQYLRVYVRQLRQKIEAEPERPQYILTETGIGYRLKSPD